MNFTELNSQLVQNADSIGDQLQQSMNGDMTDPENWAQVQKQVGEYMNMVNLQSALISDVKTTISNITQKT
jgi:type III secretion apparatus needle protein